MLMDWVVIFEDERRVIFEKTSVPSVSKSNPETVDRFVKEILGNIPRPAPPLPANRATQESDKKELNELIPLLNKEELKAMLKKLKEYSTIQKLEEKKVEVFYYSEQIELIKKHINDGKG